MYSKLQYISQGNTPSEQLRNIKNVLDHGCDWIQLRFKKQANHLILPLAEQIRELTLQYSAILIINDSVDIAHHVDADGVHLGLQDQDISLARSILGNSKIIGGTANTIQHVKQRLHENCNYIGLGPFRYTETKEKLSPVLGVSGYRDIMGQLPVNARIPIYAIGGIHIEDIKDIIKTGVHGIAISGALTHSPQLSTSIQKLLNPQK